MGIPLRVLAALLGFLLVYSLQPGQWPSSAGARLAEGQCLLGHNPKTPLCARSVAGDYLIYTSYHILAGFSIKNQCVSRSVHRLSLAPSLEVHQPEATRPQGPQIMSFSSFDDVFVILGCEEIC